MEWKLFLMVFFLSFKVFATECFEFEFQDFPDKSPITLDIKKEIWCYKPVKIRNYKTLIFNFDNAGISKNLGMLVSNDNKIIFLDQLYGKFRTIEQKIGLENPYQIPISPDEITTDGYSIDLSANQNKVLNEITQKLFSSEKIKISSNIERITDDLSDDEFYLPKDQEPTDGFWWPYRKIPMAEPEDSPTRIYDLYVKTKTGTDPESTEWELENHNLQDIFWGGHCNGWAAAAILHGFFDRTLLLNVGGENVEIMPWQIQGMRTETSFCVKISSAGRRFRTPETDDPKDINPVTFHKTIKYYLKELKKPVAVDRINNEVVDNSIFSGYKITVTKDWLPNMYYVEAAMKTHFYNKQTVNVKRIAEVKTLLYSYYLQTDESGNITDGQWAFGSSNPDFLWVPLAQLNCGRENPRMETKMVDEMIRTLPQVGGPPGDDPAGSTPTEGPPSSTPTEGPPSGTPTEEPPSDGTPTENPPPSEFTPPWDGIFPWF